MSCTSSCLSCLCFVKVVLSCSVHSHTIREAQPDALLRTRRGDNVLKTVTTPVARVSVHTTVLTHDDVARLERRPEGGSAVTGSAVSRPSRQPTKNSPPSLVSTEQPEISVHAKGQLDQTSLIGRQVTQSHHGHHESDGSICKAAHKHTTKLVFLRALAPAHRFLVAACPTHGACTRTHPEKHERCCSCAPDDKRQACDDTEALLRALGAALSLGALRRQQEHNGTRQRSESVAATTEHAGVGSTQVRARVSTAA